MPGNSDAATAAAAATNAAAARTLDASTSGRTAIQDPTFQYLMTHRPVAAFHLLPRDGVLFLAGALAGALGKTLTAPFDRVKILMQVKGGLQSGAMREAAASGNLLQSFMAIGKQEGLMGYWKGNLPQVARILPYSAVQLLSYEAFKKAFSDDGGKLSLSGRLCAGACAGMASTLATYPLDTLRLRLAVDPKLRTVGAAMTALLAEGGPAALFRGLTPALFGIAPYMALELASYDLLPAQVPSFARGFTAALLATSCCYPLDTLRRQIQLHSTSGLAVGAALGNALQGEGWRGLYRGFLPNAIKNLPNKGVRLTVFDTAKRLLAEGDSAYEEERQALAASRQLAGSCCGSEGRPLISDEVEPLQL